MTPTNWASALTLNRCHRPEGLEFPPEAHFALPSAPRLALPKAIGSVLLRPGTPVHWRPGTLLLGRSLYARYLVFKRKGEWLLIGWGGAFAWVRAAGFEKNTGPILEAQQRSINARLRPYYPEGKWAHLGENPTVCQLLFGRIYAAAGSLSGPPSLVEVDLSVEALEPIDLRLRWGKVTYGEHYVWVPWWQGSSKNQINAVFYFFD